MPSASYDEIQYKGIEKWRGSQTYLGVLQQRISPRRIKGGHAHIHAAEGKDSPQSFRPEVFRRTGIYALERMEHEHPQEE